MLSPDDDSGFFIVGAAEMVGAADIEGGELMDVGWE